jgi:hypothetical protein
VYNGMEGVQITSLCTLHIKCLCRITGPLKYGNGPNLAEAWWPRHWEVKVWNVM